MAEEFARALLRQALAQSLHNHGFNAATNFSLEVLLDVYRKFIESFCADLKQTVETMGRTNPILDDVGLVLDNKGQSYKELCDYLRQVEPVHFPHPVPSFPVDTAPDKPALVFTRPSAKELADRAEYFDDWLPALRPPSVDDQAADDVAMVSPEKSTTDSVSVKDDEKPAAAIRATNRRTTDRIRRQKAGIHMDDLPDFSDMDAFSLGLVRVVEVPRLPPPPPPPINTVKKPLTMAPAGRSVSDAGVAIPRLTLKLPAAAAATSKHSVSHTNVVVDRSLEDGEIAEEPTAGTSSETIPYTIGQHKTPGGTAQKAASIDDVISNVLSATRSSQPSPAPSASTSGVPEGLPVAFGSLISPALLSRIAQAGAQSASASSDRQSAGKEAVDDTIKRLLLRETLPKTREKFSNKEKLKHHIHERRLEKDRQKLKLQEQVAARKYVPVRPKSSTSSTGPSSRPPSVQASASASTTTKPTPSRMVGKPPRISVKMPQPPSGRPPSGAAAVEWERRQSLQRTPTPTKESRAGSSSSTATPPTRTPTPSASKGPTPALFRISPQQPKTKTPQDSPAKTASGGRGSPIKPFKFKFSRLNPAAGKDTAAAYVKKKKAAAKHSSQLDAAKKRSPTKVASLKIAAVKREASTSQLPAAKHTKTQQHTQPTVLNEPDAPTPPSIVTDETSAAAVDASSKSSSEELLVANSPVVVMSAVDRHCSASPSGGSVAISPLADRMAGVDEAIDDRKPVHITDRVQVKAEPPSIDPDVVKVETASPVPPPAKLIPKLKIKLGAPPPSAAATNEQPASSRAKSRSPSVTKLVEPKLEPQPAAAEQKVAPMRLSLKGLFSRAGANTSTPPAAVATGGSSSSKASSKSPKGRSRSRTTTASSARASTHGRDSTCSPAPLTPSPRSMSPVDSPLRVQIGTDEVLPSPTGSAASSQQQSAGGTLTSPFHHGRLVSPAVQHVEPKTPSAGVATPDVSLQQSPASSRRGAHRVGGARGGRRLSGATSATPKSTATKTAAAGGSKGASVSPGAAARPKITPLSIKLKKPVAAAAKKGARKSAGPADGGGGGGGEPTWTCPICAVPYADGVEMIACDMCDRWFHWTCVGIIQPPPDKQKWFCKFCGTMTPTKTTAPAAFTKNRKGSSSSVSSTGSKRGGKKK